jgi:DNA-binding XRE family transcriptional regulator
MSNEPAATAAWLKTARQVLGMTQAEMALVLGVDRQSVYRKERSEGQTIAVTHRDVARVRAEFNARGLVTPEKTK